MINICWGAEPGAVDNLGLIWDRMEQVPRIWARRRAETGRAGGVEGGGERWVQVPRPARPSPGCADLAAPWALPLTGHASQMSTRQCPRAADSRDGNRIQFYPSWRTTMWM